VFAEDGELALTDLVYPAAGSNGIKLFAEGGTASAESVAVHQMRSIWTAAGTR
jgi:sucrose-6-phosphate hydrolase SacC (GH32 family)